MAGSCPPDDETALANAMVTAISDADNGAKRGLNAHRHARENYSWRHVADRVTQLYQHHSHPARPA